MNEPSYRNQAAGEAAEEAVNRLTFNDRLVLWHRLGKKDLEEAKKRGWKQTLIGVGVAVAAAAAAAFGFTSCTYTHHEARAGELVTERSTAFSLNPGEMLHALLPEEKNKP